MALREIRREKDRTRIKSQIRFLYGLLQVINSVKYHGLTALLKEEVGVALNKLHPGRGREYLRSAAEDHRIQGDIEKGLHLDELYPERYERAKGLSRITAESATTSVDVSQKNHEGPRDFENGDNSECDLRT